jgi:hypothetical protein
MQELCDFIKRANLWIIGIEEGEEVQTKGIGNVEQNNSRQLSKSWERDTHPGTGDL